MAKWGFIHKSIFPTVVGSEKEYLYLENGQEILDAAGGAIVTNIGHGREEVIDTLRDSTRDLDYVIPPFNTPARQALTDKLVENWLGNSLSHIHYTCGGSEGIECAVKIAYMHHAAKGDLKRTKIIKRHISYHGTTLAATAIGGHESRKKGVEHILDPYPKVETPYPLRCPSSDVVGYYVENFLEVLENEGSDSIAAFIAEPICGASGGAITPPDGYFEAISQICEEHGILIIVDEVMTGFGRTGTNFGYEHWDVQPDLLVGGKGLAGGYTSITAVAGNDKVSRSLEEAGYDVMFHTFSALPNACATAHKVLEIMEREKLVERSAKMGALLQEKLTKAFSNHPHVAEVRGRGLLQGVELVKNRDTLESYEERKGISGRVSSRMMHNGVWVYKGGNGIVQDVLLVGPPFTVTEAQIDQIVGTMSEAIDHVTMERSTN